MMLPKILYEWCRQTLRQSGERKDWGHFSGSLNDPPFYVGGTWSSLAVGQSDPPKSAQMAGKRKLLLYSNYPKNPHKQPIVFQSFTVW